MDGEARRPWSWERVPAPPATFDSACDRDVRVEMRDGVGLATDVYRPVRDGEVVDEPGPALLLRTPYDKRYAEAGYARYFARHGYHVLVQDVRGTYASEGELDLLVDEAEDGAYTLGWIDAQPWSNGSVGMWGTSYSSFTQLAAATQGPTNLRCLVPNQSASHAWRSSMRHGGAFELRWLAWAFWHSAMNTQADLHRDPWVASALGLDAPSTSDWLTRLPLRPGASQLRLVPNYERWLLRLMRTSDETDLWLTPALAPVRYVERFPAADVLLMGGWYDSYTRSTIELYDAMRAQAHLDVRLLMGPWVHGASSPESSRAGDIDLGADAAVPDLRELHLRWFEHTLRGANDDAAAGEVDDLPVRAFVMGRGTGERTADGSLDHGGVWRSSASWPPDGGVAHTLYLRAEGALSAAPPEEPATATTFRFDPTWPVPSIGGNVSSLSQLRPLPPGLASAGDAGGGKRRDDVMSPGGYDQVEGPDLFGCKPPYLPLASRHDVLVFRTDPLEDDVEVTGPVRAHLYVSSTAVDTDITAKLVDEYPPSAAYPLGYALNLTDSILRLRYRDGGQQRLLEPHEVVLVTIELYPTSNVFAQDHRIRLDVSSSNFPRFDVNPNTGDPLGTERRWNVAENTIHHDPDRPSHLELTLVPDGPAAATSR